MRIGIVAVDSRGGVQPYAALGLGLQAAGHDVRMIVPKDSADRLIELGLPTEPLSVDMRAGARLAASQGGIKPGGVVPRGVRQQLIDQSLAQAVELRDASAGLDLLTGGVGGSVLGRDVAEHRGIPFVDSHLHPVGTFTRQLPGVLAPPPLDRLGAVGRMAGQALTQVALTAPFTPVRRAVRREVLGLSPRIPKPAPTTPMIYGFSRHVVVRPTDWPARCRVTGYWFLPEHSWSPPPGLTDFLAAGPPPVCIGFGSMLGEDAPRLTETVLEAVRRAGVRAILLSGWGGLTDVKRGDVLTLPEAPHSWLLPRTAAVAHHGGAGTTAAAVRAGVPSVVVPFAVDQPFWAARLHALGVAPPALPVRRLTSESLAAALHQVTTDASIQTRAARLGEQVAAEDGVGVAVAELERWWSESGPHPA